MMILLWAIAFLLLPGWIGSGRIVRSMRHRSTAERVSWAYVVGSAVLALIGMALHLAGLFSWWWATVLILSLAALPRFRVDVPRMESPVWALLALLLVVEVLMTRQATEYAFGQDVYYWTGVAREVALQGEGDRIPPIVAAVPSGYGFLLATAATFSPDLHKNPLVAFFVLLWSVFSACAAFALARRLAGPTVGAITTIVYLGSYWSLYFLVPGVSRQAWALGVAPLFLLLLVRKGHRAFRSLELYLLVGTAWLIHAFTALILLCCLPPLVFHAGRRLGWRRLERELGPVAILGALVLLSPPLVAMGRFFLAIPRVVRFIEHAGVDVMEPMDAFELGTTLGPGTLLVLGLGILALREGFRGARGRARLFGLWLLLLLLSIGAFAQLWYRSVSVALPPHRYYLFYSLVALLWSGALRPARNASLAARKVVLAFLAALAAGQLVFDAFFVRRMLTPDALVAPVLEATTWIESRASLDDTVIVALSTRSGAAQVRHLLSPRPVSVVDSHEAFPADTGETKFLLTDRSELPSGASIRFQKGTPPVTVMDFP
jgi:hypothetical protein